MAKTTRQCALRLTRARPKPRKGSHREAVPDEANRHPERDGNKEKYK